ncbi:MAG: TIM barrel protein [Paracoccus sp. (in: a-proteobacteria)]|uniref:hydroxypyruvate isomerase family protein n=1 Tax=Paracoccus sp. TaxID=267 RepID=UPI0026DEB531|nr:TIM barrel protein [Paracoccus sp. (in: a-proteobacteria)]MDO5612126.1 TIM barrel protein [Paracoccus sp. (in: a-proteobacteria)]
MPRFAANLTMLFTELPVLARFAAARDAGFQGVEMLFPYDLAPRDLARAARQNELDFVLLNCPPPNWAGGPRGFAAQPGMEDRFRRDFDRALRFAEALSARHIHVMAGKAQGDEALDTFRANLDWAANRAPHASLTIEPISQTAMPGYFLSDYDLAARIITDLGAPNLGLQFDAYHAQLITGDAVAAFSAHRPLIRHIQIAGVPDRNEPLDGGGLDYAAFFAAVDGSDYRGWVSAEYTPKTMTEAGLGWLKKAANV